MLGLIRNETVKLLRRRRPQLVFLLLAAFLGISTWAQHQRLQTRDNDERDGDWRARAEERAANLERRASRQRIFVSVNRFQRFEAARLRYHLERDIDPGGQTGPLVARGFAALASTLLLPLLVTVLGADLVTGERSAGTIKMLLTRPVSRTKVLASKLIVLSLFSTLLVAAAGLLSWAASGFVFGWQGWQAPVLTGFRFAVDGMDLTGVRMAPLWIDTVATYGLVWYGTLVVAIIALACSVLFRSSVGAMGTLLAVLVAGNLLGQMASDWEPAKWMFPTNLALPQFYSGVPPPVAGMTLGHSVAVLGAWGVAAMAVAFVSFHRKDVTA